MICNLYKSIIACIIISAACQINLNNAFSKSEFNIYFDEVLILKGRERAFKNRMSLFIKNDTIRSCLHYNDDNRDIITIALPNYKVYLEGNSIFIESLGKGKILFFSLVKNDTIPSLDIKSLEQDYLSFYGINIYEKDSVIEVLGSKRECYVLKQLGGRYVDHTYATESTLFIDKQKLFLLKQEDVYFDILDYQIVNGIRNLNISKIF